MLRAGPIHIAVIDAAPLYTFQRGELHLAQPVSGIVAALVGLLRILRVAKLSTSPRPAPTAPEKAHVLRRKRRKRPRPPSPPNDPQVVCSNPQPATPREPKTRRASERARQISLHMERLAALRWRRRRLSRARRLSPAAPAGWATAAVAPPKDGVRPCVSRRASQSSSELVAVSAGQGASEAGAEGAEGPEASPGGGEPTEAAWRARETRERRSWGGGTGGQRLVAKPVTNPVSARATEPRKPEAVLELRRGARFGSGAGERE